MFLKLSSLVAVMPGSAIALSRIYMYLIVEAGEVDEDGLAAMCAKATATGENMTSMDTKDKKNEFQGG